MPDLPTTEPTQIIAGDTLAWSKTLDDYPANDGWTLTYYLRGPAAYTITTTADDAAHVAAATTAETSLYTPGEYRLFGFATTGSTRYKVYEKPVTVFADVASNTGTLEIRSDARIIYDALIELQKQRATRPELQRSIQAAGQSFTYKSDKEIGEAIDKWGAVVKAEEEEDSGTPVSAGKDIVVRFRSE